MSAIEPGTVVEPAGEAAPAATPPDFKSVREAQAWQRENGGDPGVIVTPDEPVYPVTPAAPVEDTFEDVIPAAPVATPAAPAAPTAPVGDDPYAQYGGREAVDDAVVVANALKTEAGVRAIVAQGLGALGYDPAQVQAFLQSPEGRQAVAEATPAAPADPWADVADDDVLDGATVKQMLRGLVSEITQTVQQANAAAVEPVQAQLLADRQRVATQAVDSTLVEVLQLPANPAEVTDVQRGQIADIQNAAAKYVEPGNWDPNHIAAAIRRGAAEVTARDEARFAAYVAGKRAAKAAAPTNVGGGAPAGGEAVAPPKNAKEAAAMRKTLYPDL